MAQASKKSPEQTMPGDQIGRGLREGALYIFGAVSAYLLLSLVTYQPGSSGW